MKSETLEVSPVLRASITFPTSRILSSKSTILQQLLDVIYRFQENVQVKNEKTVSQEMITNMI
jgi:hypothetical protein